MSFFIEMKSESNAKIARNIQVECKKASLWICFEFGMISNMVYPQTTLKIKINSQIKVFLHLEVENRMMVNKSNEGI
ncbi:MAG: hypothetical protein RR954_09620 [Christensenellaceae bacterium]